MHPVEYFQKKAEERAGDAQVVGGGNPGPEGYGAESVFANTPSGPDDKGTLTKFGSEGTGAVKSMNVGTPVKEEPF